MTRKPYKLTSRKKSMAFSPAEYERESDEQMASVMPLSWEGHARLKEGAYPYRQWPGSEEGR